jgi:hypothetical protein
MIIISNASPRIALGKLGQLGLLLKFQAEILIPRAVYLWRSIIGFDRS